MSDDAIHPPGIPAGLPYLPMGRRQFATMLRAICNAAPERIVEEDGTDARTVWHAAEIALGILSLDDSDGFYAVKLEALEDMRA